MAFLYFDGVNARLIQFQRERIGDLLDILSIISIY